jgi:hypothetical protein
MAVRCDRGQEPNRPVSFRQAETALIPRATFNVECLYGPGLDHSRNSVSLINHGVLHHKLDLAHSRYVYSGIG